MFTIGCLVFVLALAVICLAVEVETFHSSAGKRASIGDILLMAAAIPWFAVVCVGGAIGECLEIAKKGAILLGAAIAFVVCSHPVISLVTIGGSFLLYELLDVLDSRTVVALALVALVAWLLSRIIRRPNPF